jgi:RNA polymerase primary sigma factor
MAAKVARDEMRIDELVDGLIDPNAAEDIEALAETRRPPSRRTSRGGRRGRRRVGLPAAAESRCAGALHHHPRLFVKMQNVLAKKGPREKAYLKIQQQISGELMNIRFTARIIERLCDSVRHMVEDVRNHERKILELCVKKGNMPRPHFIKVFPGNETNLEWLKHEVTGGKPYAATLMRAAPAISKSSRS